MKSLYQILILLCMAPMGFAAEYEGTIIRVRSKLAVIESKTQKKLLLTFQSKEIEQQISKLKTKDYISFEGAKNTTAETMRIDSVNYVGLSSLVGKWSGNDKFCYEFVNFVEMYVFLREKTKCNFTTRANARYMTYTVNPTTRDWIALISDDTSSYAAEIKIKSEKRVDLSLYDSETGDILGTIILKK